MTYLLLHASPPAPHDDDDDDDDEVTPDHRTMASRPNAPRAGHDHAPAHPSGLRQTYTASSSSSVDDNPDPASPDRTEHTHAHVNAAGPSRHRPTEATALLGSALLLREEAHDGPCNHGTFSPRPTSPTSTSSLLGESLPGSPSESDAESSLPGAGGLLSDDTSRRVRSWKRQWAAKMRSKKMSNSSALAERHGVKDSALM